MAWTTAAGLFSSYLRSLATYTITYGSLGGIVVSLLFFYISGVIFIFGAEINAAIMRGGPGHRQRTANVTLSQT